MLMAKVGDGACIAYGATGYGAISMHTRHQNYAGNSKVFSKHRLVSQPEFIVNSPNVRLQCVGPLRRDYCRHAIKEVKRVN